MVFGGVRGGVGALGTAPGLTRDFSPDLSSLWYALKLTGPLRMPLQPCPPPLHLGFAHTLNELWSRPRLLPP